MTPGTTSYITFGKFGSYAETWLTVAVINAVGSNYDSLVISLRLTRRAMPVAGSLGFGTFRVSRLGMLLCAGAS